MFMYIGKSDVEELPIETIIGATIGGLVVIIAIIVCAVCTKRIARHKYAISIGNRMDLRAIKE